MRSALRNTEVMQVTEIDFLPSEYWKRRQSQRDQWYLLGIGLASLFPLLTSFLHESNAAAALRQELASVDSELREATLQVEGVERLKARCVPLAFDARLYALLRARPSLSRAIAAVAASCPQHLTLDSMRVRPAKLQRSDPKTPNPRTPATSQLPAQPVVDIQVEQLERFATDREFIRLSIELSGVAESDLDIAELIEHLESAGCFKEVNLATVDYQPAGILELRQFKITCHLAEVL
jgi:hypothetical protein